MSRRIVQITGPAARYFAFAALSLGACDGNAADSDAIDSGAADGVTEIRYTEYGIPHIRADGYESLGFGQGYAQARDNLCDIEHGMLAFDGRLSRYFGPDAPGSSLTPSGTPSLITDLYHRGLNDSGVVEKLVAQPAPLGPREEVRQIVRGYVDGFNALLAERPALSCIDAAWVRPMQEIDVYRRAYAMSTYLGQAVFAEAIVLATAPVASPTPTSQSRTNTVTLAGLANAAGPASRPGSNAIALGSEATDTGGGINLANPHLSWGGDLRWSQAQLTIAGELDVSGAGVLGLPLIVMGHTATAAWSITTAEAALHFTLFELMLADDSPTTYLVDGVPEAMQRRDVSVEVHQPDGSLERVTHEQWWTRYGPVLAESEPFAWVPSSGGAAGRAYVVGDPNASNMRMLNTLLAFDHSASTGDVHRALRDNQGAPWWTVVAADADGQTLFSQIHVVPNVPDAHAERCNIELVRESFPETGLAVLDGSRRECAWLTDPDALEPGIFGPGKDDDLHLPALSSRKYVANSNDSYWQPNVEQRITGLPRILGDEATERSLRTRDTFTEIEDQLARGPFSREAMQDLFFSHRSYAAELVVDDTLAMCRDLPDTLTESSDGQSVRLAEACAVLARWDRRMNSDSRGALLFDRYWRLASARAGELGVSLFSTPFDARDPIDTPRTLDIRGPVASQALADAVLSLSDAGIAPDAKLGDHQYIVRGGQRLPLGGGTDALGVFNLLHADWSPEQGYTEPFTNASGYVHIVKFDGTPCPDAVTLLTYSQSVEASSPHHADQTALYSAKGWVTERFCEADILSAPELEVVRFDGGTRR